MYPKVATTYDQNPKRIRLVARRRNMHGHPLLPAVIGIQLMVGLVAAFAWNYLPL